MAFGDLLVQLKVPEKPQGASETDAVYREKVKQAASAYFVTTGITPARYSWLGRSDVPDDQSAVGGFAAGRIAETEIDPDQYTFAPATTTLFFCIVNGEVRYCTTIIPDPISDDPADNEFKFNVALDNNLTVSVEIRLVVRSLDTFPIATS